jgi:plastocyanin
MTGRRRLAVGALLLGTGLVALYAVPWGTVRRSLSPAVPPKTVTVTIQNLTNTPGEISVAVGDTVEWVNRDVVAHTATARNGAWSAVVMPSETARLVMRQEGVFDYFCQYHPNMTGRVTVTGAR